MNAVLWDLDDTLLNTLPARMRAVRHAHEKTVGGWIDPLELWKSHRGGTLEALGQRLLGTDGGRFVTAYRDYYYNEVHRAPPFEGVEPVLATLQEHGLPMAVVTSKISWGATEELDESGLLRFFSAVVGFDDTEQHKPDPAPIFEAMSRILVDDPAEVLFVGDSPADIFAARNAGCVSVAALWGTLDRELLLDAYPVHLAEEPHEVLAVIERAGARQ